MSVNVNPPFLTFNKRIKLLYGPETHPGGGHLDKGNYGKEISLFENLLNEIKTEQPLMIEIGSFWAFWSLLFRDKFPSGKNILIELGKNQLEVGLVNFALNKLNCISYWGGVNLNSSQTYRDRQLVLQQNSNDQMVGPEISFDFVLESNKIDTIDLLHMDIQGSELAFLISNEHKLSKINKMIIATHNHLFRNQMLHEKCIEILQKNSFSIKHDIRSNTEDGMIFADRV